MKKIVYTKVITMFQVARKAVELGECENLEKERVDYEWIIINDWHTN